MPKFQAYGVVVGTKYLGEFEAATEEEARDMALCSGEASISLCHQCDPECGDAHVEEVNLEVIEEPRKKGKGK